MECDASKIDDDYSGEKKIRNFDSWFGTQK